MTAGDFAQIALYIGVLTALTPLLGSYMFKVFTGAPTLFHRILAPIERLVYKAAGVDAEQEMNWKQYTLALMAFNAVGFVVLFLLQVFQSVLPFNPEAMPNVPVLLAFNTAVSFVTNTNWQAYSGEAVLSYGTQMLGLTVQNFVSAATGIAVLLAIARGLARKSSGTIGNFWADMVRSTVYVLLPLAVVCTVIFVGQGVVQTFSTYTEVTTLEGAKQTIPLGPAASQIAIKQLGSNGGGFFGVNSAHPFENPTPLTNFVQMLALLLLAAALTYTFGKIAGSTRQGWTLFSAMMVLFVAGLALALWAEYSYNPVLHASGVLEGKEVRFGIVNSVLWSTATTAASNGSVNAMHDSLSPLAGMVAMVNIMLGEVVFGGVGAGLYGMLMFVLVTVFVAGLMVGRTPEYLGKKVEAFDVKMAMIAILAPCALMLVFSAVACVTESGLSSLTNKGPHGLSEILYAFASAAGNNGSAFGGLSANTDFYNILTAVAMLLGRFGIIVPVLAIAGNMAAKNTTPPSTGTFPTDKPLFVVLLVAIVLIVGALTFFPALSLGPILDHLLMRSGTAF